MTEASSLLSRLKPGSAQKLAAPATTGSAKNGKFKGTLIAKGLTKSYKGRQVVSGVTLGVRAGEAVGLLGPNGAGKTTCFYMITGLVPADQGTIEIDGFDVTAMPMYRRARLGIGYLPAGGLDLPWPERRGQHPRRARSGRDRKERERRSMRCWKSSTSAICARRRRSRSRAASGGAAKSRARWPASPPTCCSTSPLPASIRSPSPTSSNWCAPDRARHRRADHRPQCARDAGPDRPRLHHPCRRGADPRPRPTRSSPIPMSAGSISARASRSDGCLRRNVPAKCAAYIRYCRVMRWQ
jgi:energy-coupling factor transporter ATP-binding protein EcfA2